MSQILWTTTAGTEMKEAIFHVREGTVMNVMLNFLMAA